VSKIEDNIPKNALLVKTNSTRAKKFGLQGANMLFINNAL